MLENLDWRVVFVVFIYCYVALSLYYLWRKRLDMEANDDPCDDWSKTPLPQKPKPKVTFEETGEVVGTTILHMAERLKVENHEDKPHWPVKENK
jgi:hypothetical protein